jgi:PAS domain S-box-containing protein
MDDELDDGIARLLRAAVEFAPNGFLLVDARGSIVLVNREIERIFGYSRSELVGKSIEILVPPRARAAHPELRQEFFADPSARAMGAGRDLTGLRKDGSEVPVEIGLNPIRTSQGLVVLSSIVDISRRREQEVERHRLEEELRQSQKLEALGTLAGGIAHDFNNVLSAIVGFAELASAAPTVPDVGPDLREILEAAERGRDLVRRILSFARRQEIVLKPIDLGAAIGDAIRLLKSTLPATIDLRVALTSEPLCSVADATSVQQVVMNLATNAAQSMPGGGVLEIDLEPASVSNGDAPAFKGLREGDHALLVVRDTGSGMAPEILAHAFEPFFTTKPPGQGTGLGLATVQSILVKLGGGIDLESAPGSGTIARCWFPLVASEKPVAVDESTEIPRGAGQRLLVVDDEPVLVRAWARQLERIGYRVTALESARRALAAVERAPHAFDAALLDRLMPELDGVGLAVAIHSIRPDLPILLMSGFIEDLPSDRYRDLGIRTVLMKPVPARVLAFELRRLFD